MAPADRNPNRRASPMPASETHTSRDDIEPTRVERTVLPGERSAEGRGDKRRVDRDPKPSEELTRRLDLSEDPRLAAARRDPRTTDIFIERPDVIGAPERTVVEPLPPRHEEVEPVPDAASTNGARVAAEVEARRARRAREDAQREEARREAQRRDERRAEQRRDEARRDEVRRERPQSPAAVSRDTDKELGLAVRNPAKEKTQPSASVRDAERQRNQQREQRRRDVTQEDDPLPSEALLHSPTHVDRVNDDTPWSRLGTALRDVSRSIAVSAKEGWHTLRYEGVRPFFDKAKPRLVRAWHSVRGFALRLRIAAVAKAAEIGLVSPKRLKEYAQEGDDRLDASRVDAWRRFNKGKTSSSYLQDDE